MRVPLHRAGLLPLLAGAFLLVAFVVARSIPGVGAEDDPAEKYGPRLRLALTGGGDDAAGGIGARATGTQSVIIRADADVSGRLRALGATVRSVIGDGAIITADVPVSALPAIAALAGVRSIEAPHPLTPTNDLAAASLQVTAVWQLTNAGLPIEGNGVLVGIVDSGIDLAHEDFKWADGTSQVVRVWDQTSRHGAPPAGFSYGHECRGPDFAACPQVDTDGHGTHVAGTAAGTGRSTPDRRFRGMAPAADLAIVKSGLDSAQAIDAWVYLIRLARERGRPIVINNSWGAHFGPHDGRDDLSLAIDRLSGPGRIFVKSAGNDGDLAIHARGVVTTATSMMVNWDFPPIRGPRQATLLAWTDPNNAIAYAIRGPGPPLLDNEGNPCPLPIAPGAVASPGLICVEPRTGAGILLFNGRDPATGQAYFQAAISAVSPTVGLTGTWELIASGTEVRGNGTFDAWLIGGPGGGGRFRQGRSDLLTISEPGLAAAVVTIGSYVSRISYQALDGNTWTLCPAARIPITATLCRPPVLTDTVSTFSSRGPSRDGRQKPDAVAPGQHIISTLSKDYPATPDEISPDGRHYVLFGTSMAAPQATGVIALLLQKNPTLTPDQVKAALRGTARRPAGVTWSPDVGAGRIDALAAYQAIAPPRAFLPLIGRLTTAGW